jgi:ABC-type glycerol-3-phosphate transport system substrate-binding protein
MSASDVRARLGRLCLMCAIVCLLPGLAVGCVGATPTPEPVTISFAHAEFDTGLYQQLLQEFNESHPYITVELLPRNWDVLGGLDPEDADVFVTSQFEFRWLHGEGGILDLTPFIEQDEAFETSDFYPGTVGLFTTEGKTWAVPAGVDMMVMFYNQDLFDTYDVPPPEIGWTWDDFLARLAALRDPGAGVFGYAPNYATWLDPLAFIYQHGGRIFDDLQNPTRTTFDGPLAIEALDWYFNLMHKYDLVPTPEQAREAFGSRTNIRNGVYLGQVGMWTGMLSERGGRLWPAEWDMRWGMVSLPRDERAATLTVVEGYFISSQAPHPDACWQWVAFLSQQVPGRQAPARRSLAESTAYEQRVGGDVAAVARASMDDALLLSPELAEFEQALGVFNRAVEAIIDQRLTPREAMIWAQEQSQFK